MTDIRFPRLMTCLMSSTANIIFLETLDMGNYINVTVMNIHTYILLGNATRWWMTPGKGNNCRIANI